MKILVSLLLALTLINVSAQEKRLRAVQSLGELVFIDPLNPDTDVLVEGNVTSGDGGGGIFRFYSDIATATNATTVLAWRTNPSLGRWVIITANINPSAFGVVGTNFFPAWSAGSAPFLTATSWLYNASGGVGLNIGTNTLRGRLHVAESSTNLIRGIVPAQYSSDTNGSRIVTMKSRGTLPTPAVIASGDGLGSIVAYGFDGTTFLEVGEAGFVSTGTIAANRVPSEWVIYTSTDAGPSVKTLRMIVTQDGIIGIGGKTSSQPGIRANSTQLVATLADGSADASFRAAHAFVGTAGQIGWSTRSLFTSPADGRILARNAAGTDFTRFSFGAETAAFPMFLITGTNIAVRLADNSGVAPFGTGKLTVAGQTVNTPDALQSLAAGTATTTFATTARVVGNGGAVTITATPSIADGIEGQILRIFGTDDTNTITYQDEAGLAGSNLQLGAATRVLGLGDILVLYFDTTAGFWYEQSFTNN